MIDSSRLDSFISSSQLCSDSQSDYSTCITNNLRFMEFLEDDYKKSNLNTVSITNRPISVPTGKTFIDAVPLAMANIVTRIKMVNDYGVVDFRCSEIFDRPRLPLLSLQDLGLDEVEITNIKGLDPVAGTATNTFFGIPLGADLYLNIVNLIIGYDTHSNIALSKMSEMSKIITGSLDYTKLPTLSQELNIAIQDSYAIYLRILQEIDDYIYPSGDEGQLTRLSFDAINSTLATSDSYLTSIRINLQLNIIDPLSIIDSSTYWPTFDYSITQGVLVWLDTYKDVLKHVTNYNSLSKQFSAISGIPPSTNSTTTDLEVRSLRTAKLAAGLYILNISEALAELKAVYQITSNETLAAIRSKLMDLEIFIAKLDENAMFLLDFPMANLSLEYKAMLEAVIELKTLFSFEYSEGFIYDKLSSSSKNTHLDKYITEIGDPSSILINKIVTLRSIAGSEQSNTVELGGSFKDSGSFYYADLAYSVGYGKMTNIHTIQIDDELYELTKIVNEAGEIQNGVSDSGCTKYVFTRHVLPTYDVEVELYIYAGVPDQPFCPTINKYHNFATSKYSGMFSKINIDGLMGLYMFKGYRPMHRTVEEVIELGKLDLNAINFNDPSINKGSYKDMLQSEIKNLTNASSIVSDGTITTKDFKYYLSSTLVDESAANNFPGLMILEFKNLPLGGSFKFPKIKINATVVDPIGV